MFPGGPLLGMRMEWEDEILVKQAIDAIPVPAKPPSQAAFLPQQSVCPAVCLPLLYLSDGQSHSLLFTLPTGHVGLEHIPSLVTVDECSPIKISSHPHTRLQSKIMCFFYIVYTRKIMLNARPSKYFKIHCIAENSFSPGICFRAKENTLKISFLFNFFKGHFPYICYWNDKLSCSMILLQLQM